MSQCTSCGGDCRKVGCDRSNAKWKTCAIHGNENPNVFGCPECLRELREENKRLNDALTKEEERSQIKNNDALAWYQTAHKYKYMLAHAMDYVDAYIKRCDVEEGLQGAEAFLKQLDDVFSENQGGQE